MLAKGTPSKAQQHSDYVQRTPARPIAQRCSFGGSPPRLYDRGTPRPALATPLSPPPFRLSMGAPQQQASSSSSGAVLPPPMHWNLSPPGRLARPALSQAGSPLTFTQMAVPPFGASGSAGLSGSTPAPLFGGSPGSGSGGQPGTPWQPYIGLATPATNKRQAAFTPHSASCCMSPGGVSNRSPTRSSATSRQYVIASPVPNVSLSTPSRVITITTPLRPCSKAKHKEIQDDIKAAVDERSVPLLRVALQRHHPCTADHALHEAIRQAHVPAVRLLLNGRADPNVRCQCLERGCEYPLQLAVTCTTFLRSADRCQVVEFLLNAGAMPSPKRGDAEGSTPLHDAVRRADVNIMQLLLRHGANANAVNNFGETPLHIALRPLGGDFLTGAACRLLVETLLEAGACPLAQDGHGLLPVALAVEPEIRELLSRWTRWWRCRPLAWIRSRAEGHPLFGFLPDLCIQVAAFL